MNYVGKLQRTSPKEPKELVSSLTNNSASEDVFLFRLGTSSFLARDEVPNSFLYSSFLPGSELVRS